MKYFAVVLVILCMTSNSYPQIPNRISYQGLLTTSTGAPAASGTYDLKFEIFNASSGGTLRFSETQTGVIIVDGTFSVALGSVATLGAIFGEPLWVEVTALSGPGIGAPVTFSPRSDLLSVPYSLAPWVPGTSGTIHYNSGNVGIGTETPGVRLQVAGDDATTTYQPATASLGILNTNTTANNWSILSFQGHTTGGVVARAARIGAQITAHNASSLAADLVFSTANSGTETQHMRITSGGNVGIGTTTPANALQLHRSGSTTSALHLTNDLSGSTGTDGLLVNYHYTDGAEFWNYENTDMWFGTNSNRRMTISKDGNVGIGTASPGSSNLLELSSTTKGFVLPRMTRAERDAITSPVEGMMIFQTDNTPGLRVYDGSDWMRFTETAD